MSKLKWTSLRIILDKILRDPIFIGLNYETVIDYFIDFITIVGTPDLFEEKIVTDIPVANYRVELPIDFVEEIQITMDKKAARYSTDTYMGYYENINSNNDNQMLKDVIELTYKISGNYMYLCKKEGLLTMVYKCVKLQDDEDAEDFGYPMLPDDPVFMLAFQAYVEVQFMRMLYRAGKVTAQMVEETKQTYAWAVGRYETHSKRLSVGSMESISRMFRSIVGKNNEFYTRFKNLGSR